MKEWVRGRAQKRGMKCRGRGQSIGGDATQVLSPAATRIGGMLHSNRHSISV